MAPAATTPVGRNSPKPPPNRIWSVNDPPFEGFKPVDRSGWERSTAETAIIIDNGAPVSLLWQPVPSAPWLTQLRLVDDARRVVV